MKRVILMCILFVSALPIQAQLQNQNSERVVKYLGCEIFDQATTLSFQDDKQLKVLIIHPIETSGIQMNFEDFILQSEDSKGKTNTRSVQKEFTVSFNDLGQIISIWPKKQILEVAENSK